MEKLENYIKREIENAEKKLKKLYDGIGENDNEIRYYEGIEEGLYKALRGIRAVQMKKYELVYILDVNTKDVDAQIRELKDYITSQDGTIEYVENKGKKQLAYNIKEHTHGIFVQMEILANNDIVTNIERQLRIDNQVLKFITIENFED